MHLRVLGPGAMAALLLTTAACTGGSGGSTPDDAATAQLDTDAVCEIFYGGDDPLEQRIGTSLVELSQSFDAPRLDEALDVAMELSQLQPLLPEELVDPVSKIRTPFTQLQEHVDLSEEGETDLDIPPVVEGLEELRAICGAVAG